MRAHLCNSRVPNQNDFALKLFQWPSCNLLNRARWQFFDRQFRDYRGETPGPNGCHRLRKRLTPQAWVKVLVLLPSDIEQLPRELAIRSLHCDWKLAENFRQSGALRARSYCVGNDGHIAKRAQG